MNKLDQLEKNDYGMFSDHGNQLVADLVKEASCSDREELKLYLKSGVSLIDSFGHGEVVDTDVRDRIVSDVYNKTGMRISIYDIVP